jgi:hypothetical protein
VGVDEYEKSDMIVLYWPLPERDVSKSNEFLLI